MVMTHPDPRKFVENRLSETVADQNIVIRQLRADLAGMYESVKYVRKENIQLRQKIWKLEDKLKGKKR
jgi:hypothetical protein